MFNLTKFRTKTSRDNFQYITGLILDIDDNLSIEEAKEEFKDYKYIIYTTHNHTNEKNKYRLILDFDTYEMNLTEYEQFIKGFETFRIYNKIDKASFSVSQRFVCPSINSLYYYNEGKPLEIFDYIKIGKKQLTLDKKYREFNKLFFKAMGFSDNMSFDRSNSKAVVYYMNKSYPKISGNGDSQYSLFRAMISCIGGNDTDTLENVYDKALSEKWDPYELDKMIDKAEIWIENNR